MTAQGESLSTTDHDTIRQWAEARGGQPAGVKDTGGGEDPGVIRIDFPGYGADENLEKIDWDEWFDKFERNDLAFVYQERTADGELSTFNRLVSRD